jgi:hypothetical protein
MLKSSHSLKDTEARAEEALRQLLASIPVVAMKGVEHGGATTERRPDLLARIKVAGRAHQLVCEVRSSGQPRYARAALLELGEYAMQRHPQAVPIFIAPYLSPAVRALCREKGVGYLDLQGNAWLTEESSPLLGERYLGCYWPMRTCPM